MWPCEVIINLRSLTSKQATHPLRIKINGHTDDTLWNTFLGFSTRVNNKGRTHFRKKVKWDHVQTWNRTRGKRKAGNQFTWLIKLDLSSNIMVLGTKKPTTMQMKRTCNITNKILLFSRNLNLILISYTFVIFYDIIKYDWEGKLSSMENISKIITTEKTRINARSWDNTQTNYSLCI